MFYAVWLVSVIAKGNDILTKLEAKRYSVHQHSLELTIGILFVCVNVCELCSRNVLPFQYCSSAPYTLFQSYLWIFCRVAFSLSPTLALDLAASFSALCIHKKIWTNNYLAWLSTKHLSICSDSRFNIIISRVCSCQEVIYTFIRNKEKLCSSTRQVWAAWSTGENERRRRKKKHIHNLCLIDFYAFCYVFFFLFSLHFLHVVVVFVWTVSVRL